jgi:hypothetical protein
MKKFFVPALCIAVAVIFITALNIGAQDQAKGKMLSNTFNEPKLGYSLSYPDTWVYTFQAPHIVVFGVKQIADGEATVSIRNLNSTRVSGGNYKDVDQVIESILNQLKTAKDVVVYNPEPFQYAKGQTKLTGKQFVAEYAMQGEKYKQLIIVLPRPTGEVFHVWSFVSKAKKYDSNLGMAQAMLNSWTLQ